MSVNGYICIEITTDAKHWDEARRWAKENRYAVHVGRDDKLTMDADYDVSWFDSALQDFAREASSLAIPASEWKADVHYSCEEGACDWGGNIHVTIADGKIASFQESRIEMVEVEPWCGFELEKEETCCG